MSPSDCSRINLTVSACPFSQANTKAVLPIINLRIPHIGEQIFASLETDQLIQCLKVSQTWRVLAGKVLLNTWKGKMFQACQTGKTEIVQLLLENCSPEENGFNLKEKSHFNARSDAGMTSFMIACKKGYKDVVELLLTHPGGQKIDFNVLSNYFLRGRTAFMMACENGHVEVVQLMLEHHSKIDINVRGPLGWNALELADRKGHNDVVHLILQHKEHEEITPWPYWH